MSMKLIQACDYISVELEEVRELFDQELQSDLPIVADMLEEVGKFRGKMLRPILVLLTGKSFGPVQHAHRVIATVMEMVHMATLVHDDVLDEAEHRRRGQTINALHGNEAAVILGDLLFSHAYHLCSSLDNQLASRLVAATAITVCEGELQQLYHRGVHDLPESIYLDIISRKTARLTASSCYLGGYASGADESTCRALEQFGHELGVAFQIMDDVMDLVGDESLSGKTLGTDLLKEKMTLPLIHYFEHCPASDKAQARQVLESHDNQAFGTLIEQLEQSGSFTHARQEAARRVKQAIGALPSLPDRQAGELLGELAQLIVD